jgi:hypothetical protein
VAWPATLCSQEVDVDHPVLGLFAYQEALLIEAVFAVALLTMLWVGFRRWLRYKESLGRLIAEQTAEHAAQRGSEMERVEARLKTIEAMVSGGGAASARIEAPAGSSPPAEPISTRDEV